MSKKSNSGLNIRPREWSGDAPVAAAVAVVLAVAVVVADAVAIAVGVTAI